MVLTIKVTAQPTTHYTYTLIPRLWFSILNNVYAISLVVYWLLVWSNLGIKQLFINNLLTTTFLNNK